MKDKVYEITTESMCIYDNKLYFVPRECAVLCSWDFVSEDYTVLSTIPEEKGTVDRLFNGMCTLNGKLFLAPYNAEKVWIYEIKSNSWNQLSLDGCCDEKTSAKFVGCYGYGEHIYLFGYECNNIIRINVNDGSIEKVLITGKESHGSFWGQSVCVIDSILYVANLKEYGLCAIDLEKGSGEYLKEPGGDCAFCGVCINENVMYAMPYCGNNMYEIENDGKNAVINLPEQYKTDRNIFNGLVASDTVTLLYSPYGKSLLMRDRGNDQEFDGFGFVRFALYDTQVGFIVSKKGMIEQYDNNMNLVKMLATCINQDKYIRYIGENGLKSGIYQENSFFGLHEMLEIMSME